MAFDLAILILVHQSSRITVFPIKVSYNNVYLKKKSELHPNLCAEYAAHRLYSPLFSVQLQYCTLTF